MNKVEIINQIIQTLVIPLLGILVTAAVRAINIRKEQLLQETESAKKQKYISMLADIISECVTATNQTYVDELKQGDAFTKEAQKQALKKTFDNVFTILSEDAKVGLQEIYGDLNEYVLAKIESEIGNNKPKGY